MFNWDNAIALSLKTWYPKDHPLHLNPHHPLGKLLGEWGELMEDQMKVRYKPDYKPETEKELGDIWYYLRILSYQKNHQLRVVHLGNFYQEKSVEYLISVAVENVSKVFQQLEDYFFYSNSALDISYSVLLELASNRFEIRPTSISENVTNNFQLALMQLTTSNWEKLKPGSERGEEWMKARESTEYVGGKVARK